MAEFAAALKTPRKAIMLVKAGKAVDAIIEQVLAVFEKGDIIIDGGNEWYENTERRSEVVKEKGLLYVGMGISGGEVGARHGPSLMPGGSKEAYDSLEPILKKISAQVEDSPCVCYIGEGGSGNYVKMVHNGIEYGDMELICEAYDILKISGLSNSELEEIFNDWNKSELSSYLIEISGKIFGKLDEDVEGCEANKKEYLLDKILDCSGSKGTGMWTVEESAREYVSCPTIAEALYSRYMSSLKDERVSASSILHGPPKFDFKSIDKEQLINDVKRCLYCCKLCSYSQGLNLIRAMSKTKNWNINLSDCLKIWRGGCIIRAKILDKLSLCYIKNSEIDSILVDAEIAKELNDRQDSWRRVISLSVATGYTLPAMSASLGYYDSYRRARLPANLLQAQRDFFGSHMFERIDKKRGEFYHCQWTPEHFGGLKE